MKDLLKKQEDWTEPLYCEVLEDLIFYSKMFYKAKDKVEAMEDIRNNVRKTEDWIENHTKQSILAVLEALEEEVGKNEKKEFHPANQYLEDTAIAYNQALSDTLSLITLTKEEIIVINTI